MSTSYLVGLVVAVTLVLGARLTFTVLPLRRVARLVTITDAVLFGVGVVGLVLHCGAMFFPRVVELLPDAVSNDIRALGAASIFWYLVPTVLVLLGLRHQHPAALAVVVLALAAVGVSMYNGGSLQVHLTAIFVSVLVLASVVSVLVLPPWRRGPAVPLPDGTP